MAYLIDTSILARLVDSIDPAHGLADRAIEKLHARGVVLHITAQNLIEFRSVATRPKAMNGLGLTASEAEESAAAFEALFPLLEGIPDIYPAWKALVEALSIIGKQVHDARLVAVCHAHRVTHLLTFNVQHFTRLAGFGNGVVVVDPSGV